MLTPLDIQGAAFHRAFRGYAEKEVDDFLDRVVIEYERIYRENLELRDRLAALKDTRREVAATLEPPTRTLLEVAPPAPGEETQRVVAEARAEAERIRQEARLAVTREASRLEDLRRQYQLFSTQFRAMLVSYYRMLGQAETDVKGVDLQAGSASVQSEAAAAGLE